MDDKFIKLSEHIRDGFFSILTKLYDDSNDIPNVRLKIYIEKTGKDSVLYSFDRYSIIDIKKSTIIKAYNFDFISFDYQGDFAGYCRFYEPIDDYRFVFMLNDGLPNEKKFFIWQIGKYYFHRIIRFVNRVIKQDNEYFAYTILGNIEKEENSIISNAVLDFFSTIYGLDTNMITALSTLTYESQTTNARIYKPLKGICRSQKKSQLSIKLKNKLEFSNANIRQIKKLLEIAKPPLGLVVGKNDDIIGFSNEIKDYECIIELESKLLWNISFNGYHIRYHDGMHSIPSCNATNQFDVSILNVFPRRIKEKLTILITEAYKQKHGALLVFSETENIIDEVKRLGKFNRGFEIRQFNLLNRLEYLEKITSIDGATFIDLSGICYGVGIILDGDMVTQGDLARGARYNSAVNYVERQFQLKKEFIAVIISEDKSVDIYMPQK